MCITHIIEQLASHVISSWQPHIQTLTQKNSRLSESVWDIQNSCVYHCFGARVKTRLHQDEEVSTLLRRYTILHVQNSSFSVVIILNLQFYDWMLMNNKCDATIRNKNINILTIMSNLLRSLYLIKGMQSELGRLFFVSYMTNYGHLKNEKVYVQRLQYRSPLVYSRSGGARGFLKWLLSYFAS